MVTVSLMSSRALLYRPPGPRVRSSALQLTVYYKSALWRGTGKLASSQALVRLYQRGNIKVSQEMSNVLKTSLEKVATLA